MQLVDIPEFAVRIGDRSDTYRFLAIHETVPDSPERRLLMAVMKDAIHTLEWYSPKRKEYLETVRWFKSTSRSSPFSFLCICDMFNLHPDVILRKIRKYLK
jgi:hypothetical protein